MTTGAEAERLVLEGRCATGLVFRYSGTWRTMQTRQEVILCGGAVTSPWGLLPSGIGQGIELQATGIASVHEVPGGGT